MIDEEDRGAAATLLAWWREMGVDGAFDEAATDWLGRDDAVSGAVPGAAYPLAALAAPSSAAANPASALGRVPPQGLRGQVEPGVALPRTPIATPSNGRPPLRVSEAPRRFTSQPPDAAALAARTAARQARTLDDLRTVLDTFEGCALKATAKSLCFYRGQPLARLMIVGEAPGRDEDIEGKPFVGRAGQLLDRMLAAMGLGEDDVHITNVVYWRPPGNRTPTPQEIQVCRPFLERQIELVAPDVIMTVGGPATGALLGVEGGIMRARGRWREVAVAGRTVPAMPTLHPAYLLRTPIAKRQAWRDLLAVQERLNATAGK